MSRSWAWSPRRRCARPPTGRTDASATSPGNAEAIPLADASCDVAFLTFVVHHVANRRAAAAELCRVLTPGGRALVFSVWRENQHATEHVRYWPEALPIAEAQMPSAGEVVADFTPVLRFVAADRFEQEVAPSLRTYAERSRKRAISTLELLDDDAFERGIARLDAAAAAETTPTPVHGHIDVLVFERS